ncbi:glycosyltransferase family 4 protein, partial [bacterium]|nr:glycosyltransferase family 4 protein [bacterium]
LPTLSEGFPRVLYEAMSQSLPIITTDAGGIKGLMKHEENALIIPPKSEDVIAEAVKNIIRDTKKRKHLIKKGLETIEPIFEIDQITQIRQLLKIYFPNEYIMLKIHKF